MKETRYVSKVFSDNEKEIQVGTKRIHIDEYTAWEDNEYKIFYHKEDGSISICDGNVENHIYLYPEQVKILKYIIEKKFDKLNK